MRENVQYDYNKSGVIEQLLHGAVLPAWIWNHIEKLLIVEISTNFYRAGSEKLEIPM